MDGACVRGDSVSDSVVTVVTPIIGVVNIFRSDDWQFLPTSRCLCCAGVWILCRCRIFCVLGFVSCLFYHLFSQSWH